MSSSSYLQVSNSDEEWQCCCCCSHCDFDNNTVDDDTMMQLVKRSSSSVKKESSNDKNDADAIDNDNMSLVSMQSAATAPVGGEQKNVWHAVKHQKWWSQVGTTENAPRMETCIQHPAVTTTRRVVMAQPAAGTCSIISKKNDHGDDKAGDNISMLSTHSTKSVAMAPAVHRPCKSATVPTTDNDDDHATATSSKSKLTSSSQIPVQKRTTTYFYKY